MSGICGIAFSEQSRQEAFQCLEPMVLELDPLKKSSGQIKIGDLVGVAAQDFPGRMSGLASLTEQRYTHFLGFHGSLYNMDEIGLSSHDKENCLSVMLRQALQDIEALLKSLRGEFVISVWDARHETLYLASDRFRVHPLFFIQDVRKIVFSSRMKGLLACPYARPFTIDPRAIIDVISSSYIPTPRTIFREVQKLPPGQLLSWKRGAVDIKPYWDMSFRPASSLGYGQLSKELKKTFYEAVTARVQYEDHPDNIGCFLSGGIDSSTVLGVLTKITNKPMKSFSIGFGEEVFNETSFARCAANAFGAKQHEYIVTAEDTFELMSELVEAFDEPYANASAIPTYFCAKLAKAHGVTILYGGDGGDELFAGNERYATQKIFDYYHMIPRLIRDLAIEPSVSTFSKLSRLQVLRKGQKYIQRANTPYPDRLLSWGLFEVVPIQEVFSDEFLETLGPNYDPHHHIRDLYAYSKDFADTELDRQLYLDLKCVISDNDVLKVTRMTEANGVAVRFPFLDHQLAEFAGMVPARLKMQGTKLRTFFKNTYADLLPQEILTKSKHGFGLPIPIWLRTNKQLREMMIDLLCSPTLRQRGYFGDRTIDDLIQRHKEDTTSFFGTMLWNCVMLELWLRRYHDTH